MDDERLLSAESIVPKAGPLLDPPRPKPLNGPDDDDDEVEFRSDVDFLSAGGGMSMLIVSFLLFLAQHDPVSYRPKAKNL